MFQSIAFESVENVFGRAKVFNNFSQHSFQKSFEAKPPQTKLTLPAIFFKLSDLNPLNAKATLKSF